jgi:hypothetical protein
MCAGQIASPIPRKRVPTDVVLGFVLMTIFILHIGEILLLRYPLWGFCFPFTPIAPYFWELVAIIAAVTILVRCVFDRSRRVLRLVIAVLVIAFSTDSFLGGDFRWFALTMQTELQRCGGASALQAWAQSALSTPQNIASYENSGLDLKTLPPQFHAFAVDFHPDYVSANAYGPAFMFDAGDWDDGWGVIVGKTDFPPPTFHWTGSKPWTKKLCPGLYLFFF